MVQRRGVLLQVVAVAAGVVGLGGPVWAADGVEVTWQVPAARLSQAVETSGFPRDRIEADATSVDDTKGLPLLYLLVGVMALPALAQGLVSVYKDFAYGATIVDASGNTLQITHDPKGSADVLIVRHRDGKTTVHDGRRAIEGAQWQKILTDAAAEVAGAGGNKK
jgi:hypothetical protein